MCGDFSYHGVEKSPIKFFNNWLKFTGKNFRVKCTVQYENKYLMED